MLAGLGEALGENTQTDPWEVVQVPRASVSADLGSLGSSRQLGG